MNKKKDFTRDFGEIHEMVKKMNVIRESMDYDGYDDSDFAYDDEEEEGMQDAPAQEGAPQDGMPAQKPMSDDDEEIYKEVGDPGSAINAIREICLKGMVRLCNTPEDPEYDVLKKVFTMIDKANDKKKEEAQQ